MGSNEHGEANVWQIDKRVSVGNFIVLGAYALGFAWMMSAQNTRIDNMETLIKDTRDQFAKTIEESKSARDRQITDSRDIVDRQITDAKSQIIQIQAGNISIVERLSKLEAKTESMTYLLNRIDEKIPSTGKITR